MSYLYHNLIKVCRLRCASRVVKMDEHTNLKRPLGADGGKQNKDANQEDIGVGTLQRIMNKELEQISS